MQSKMQIIDSQATATNNSLKLHHKNKGIPLRLEARIQKPAPNEDPYGL